MTEYVKTVSLALLSMPIAMASILLYLAAVLTPVITIFNLMGL